MYTNQRIGKMVISKYLKLFSNMAKVFKEEQEQCSIITTYYAIEKDADLAPDADQDLKNTLLKV